MSYVNTDYSRYLRSYEAYRVPKDSELLKSPGTQVVKTDEDSVLVLTEEAKKKMQEDREKYGAVLELNAQMACTKTQEEATKQETENMAKIWAVFRSMCKGDSVPASDERKLMEYNDKMYQMAKNAQLMAMNEKRKKKESEWDEEEERDKRDKLNQLKSEADQAIQDIGIGSREFASAQNDAIVEIPAEAAEMF